MLVGGLFFCLPLSVSLSSCKRAGRVNRVWRWTLQTTCIPRGNYHILYACQSPRAGFFFFIVQWNIAFSDRYLYLYTHLYMAEWWRTLRLHYIHGAVEGSTYFYSDTLSQLMYFFTPKLQMDLSKKLIHQQMHLLPVCFRISTSISTSDSLVSFYVKRSLYLAFL